MADEPGAPDGPSAPTDELDSLSYQELRDRAFHRAEHRGDLGFFYGLFRHTPAMGAMADEGGSLGETSGSLIESVRAAREAFGDEPPAEMEPMFRAVFTDYLRTHPA
jgi:hypothetical protein